MFFSFPSFESMKVGLVSCYVGKGNLDWLGFILNCAVKFKLCPPSQAALQTYADLNLGIDCNGFVVVKSLSEFEAGGTYVLAKVDPDDGHILKGNGETGHIMVTSPNTRKPNPARVGPCTVAADAYTCTAVESRGGGHGLTISDYTFLSVEKQIFKIWRGCSRSLMSVRVCRLS